MPKVQYNEVTGACSVFIPKALCIAKGIGAGTVVDFILDDRGVMQIVVKK